MTDHFTEIIDQLKKDIILDIVIGLTSFDHNYSDHPEHYTRAFAILQKDIIGLFEYIEPSDINLVTYSFRIHELLVRTCIEVEANFKAILREKYFQSCL